MGNKTITITEEQFAKAVIEADRNMISELRQAGDMPEDMEFVTRLQNVGFGVELKKILFAENKGEE